MSKKAAKPDDILELIQDPRVFEVLVSRLTLILTPIAEAIFNKLAASFTANLENLVEEQTAEKLAKANEVTTGRLNGLEEENRLLSLRVDDLETYSRANNLVIYGLPEVSRIEPATVDMPLTRQHDQSQDTTQAVLAFCQTKLGINIRESDIATSHRLPRRDQNGCRPVIVRFANQQTRNLVYVSRKALRRSSSHPSVPPGSSLLSSHPVSAPLYINEHLTKANAFIFAQTRKLLREKKITSTWTSGGYTFIKRTDRQDERPRKVRTVKELDQFL